MLKLVVFFYPAPSISKCLNDLTPLSVENENHCDFTKLREMLIRTNMEDLRDTTHAKHYELYRKHRLQEVRQLHHYSVKQSL